MSTYCLEIAIVVEKYESALAGLYESGMLGCEEKEIDQKIRLNVFFKDKKTARDASRSMKSVTGVKSVISEIADQDWNAKWRENMKPACLARGWWVSPLWLPPPKTARHWIKIEPKMAFGTGHHETTRLAARAIIANRKLLKNKRALDIGAGSGVLCFVAARCGAQYAIGVEIDPLCRENLAENRTGNPSDRPAGFIIGGIDAITRAPIFKVAVMNMILTESAPLLDTLAAHMKSNGALIWSGLLTDEHIKAVELAERSGFFLMSAKTENEWWCGTFALKLESTINKQ